MAGVAERDWLGHRLFEWGGPGEGSGSQKIHLAKQDKDGCMSDGWVMPWSRRRVASRGDANRLVKSPIDPEKGTRHAS
jgi:hypothetical protein